jgi:hypothetical protein
MSRKILADQDDLIAEWVAAKVPMMELGTSPYSAIGLADRRGYLVAGVVYSNFTRTDVQAHIALLHKRALTRAFLRECFRYPFLQLCVHRITVGVAESNTASIKFVTGLGFVSEGRMREYFDNLDDCLVFGMLRGECRWLEDSHGSIDRGQHSPTGHGRTVTRFGPDGATEPHAAGRHAAASAAFRRRLDGS